MTADSSIDKQDNPGVVARPPFIYMTALLAGLVLEFFLPTAAMAPPLNYLVGIGAIGGGLAIMATAIMQFRNAGTNVPTPLPTTAIVTDGIYRFSRNPIYMALSLIYAGIGIAADSLCVLFLLAPVLLIVRFGVIAREERYLEEKFGDDYRRYKDRVRRWF